MYSQFHDDPAYTATSTVQMSMGTSLYEAPPTFSTTQDAWFKSGCKPGNCGPRTPHATPSMQDDVMKDFRSTPRKPYSIEEWMDIWADSIPLFLHRISMGKSGGPSFVEQSRQIYTSGLP
ncbi:hypothetical protein Hypma_013765 [Hypsizygus marmoreus]|uniref:Uncharacterized protein n=1 Tax=Hypsizygus marmoreus TaxID=39966 RepID=A0A369K568_HYPMA|nr:hypothetical protein Hypma_013765 [Hypsizygus marmoreus]